MEPFHYVQEASFHPNACLVCKSVTGPMVDTLATVVVGGMRHRVYLCENVCGPAVAIALGWSSPEAAEEAAATLAARDTTIAELHEQLDEARELATLTLSREELELVRSHRAEKRAARHAEKAAA